MWCIKVFQCLLIITILSRIKGMSEQGIFDYTLIPAKNVVSTEKTLFAGSRIFLLITCNSQTPDAEVQVYWNLTERECWLVMDPSNVEFSDKTKTIQSKKTVHKCSADGHIILDEFRFEDPVEASSPQTDHGSPSETHKKPVQTQVGAKTENPVFTITKDGIYYFSVVIDRMKPEMDFTAQVHIVIRGPHGYLSAVDWPFLPFYGIMCLVYLTYGIIWLVVSFLQWRDLLRIQFWIGGVILLGMLEKAVFYAYYQNINSTGVPVQSAELAAEIVSCVKRTLARMLVIIMSLGFGIVKPRLGPMLHRVVGTGALYFILACLDSYIRVMKKKTDNRELYVATIPLTVLDSGICWWIFTSLVQTTRTLRLRRNMVKLSLYRHFTNTLIFSVLASVFFMLYSIRARKTENCFPGWSEIWVDKAFWHVLFSILLLVIMILWRPTNNNQRYAFTPLLDNPEDEDDDEEEDQFVADAYGVKMRGNHVNGTRTPTAKATTTEEDDLRWVEENIPSSMAEPALPVLDSDEEIISTKFEVSKMQ